MTSAGILVRTLACFALVFATWNPSGYNFLTWIRTPGATAAEIAVAATVLLALHILFLRITWLSLGADGITAMLAMLLAGAFTLWEFDIVDPWHGQTRDYLMLGSLALIMAVGVTWSLLKRRI